MSYRDRGVSGTNNTPLGTRRSRFEDDRERDSSYDYDRGAESSRSSKRRFTDGPGDAADSRAEPAPPRRKSRWGDESKKVIIPGVPTVLPKGLTAQQTEEFLIQMKIDELQRKLRTGDVIPPEKDRSPSPEPVYGADGKRVNTRDVRYRKKIENECHKIVEDAMKRFPNFRPPPDYKKPSKIQDKLYIPARDFPDINFIGPRGNTLKKMETESGAKISIRGKGSVKEGKARVDGALAPGEEEDLHCLVTADSEEKVKLAMKHIEKIIETAASVPEGQNELKRMQLRELAALNGTLRDDENQICQNCGAPGHRRFECPETKNFTINLVCRICGGAGHIAKDCTERNNPAALHAASQREMKLDTEYASLMAELGEGGGGGGNFGAKPVASGSQSSRPPWQPSSGGGAGAPPPWAKREPEPAMNPWAAPPMPMMAPPGMGGMSGPPGAPGAWAQPPWGAPPPPPGAYPGALPPPPPAFGGYGYGMPFPGAPPPPPPLSAPPPPPPAVAPPPPPPPSSAPPPPPPPTS
ncbi:hypothetical protein HDU67_003763 [Dinochytrium kinnereticum]|nr:hypothetical protein HDU67_003763 [Dinochytrium kinnereticum]